METITPDPSFKIEPHAVSGWPLQALFDLDTCSPHFHSHVLTASALKRQAVFAAVAELVRNPGAVAAALGSASEIHCSNILMQAARSLVLLKPPQIFNAIYGSVPDALVGTMKRVGYSPFNRPSIYRDLFGLFAEHKQRARADLIRQYPGKLTEERLEIVFALDASLLHQRVFERIDDLYEAQRANAAVRLVQLTVSTATTDELSRSVAVLPKDVDLTAWVATWLKKIDKPLVEPPVFGDPQLVVLKISDLRAASMQFRNCLRERVLHVAIGRDCYVVATGSPAVVAELRRTSDGGWVLIDMWGPGNERPDQHVAEKMRSKLRAAGVVSLTGAVPQADLDALAEFFNAFDIMSGWPVARRARQRRQTDQEDA